jgi:hypothetical protein
MIPEPKSFWCANKGCSYHSRQLIERCALQINGYRLCKDCYAKGKGLRLDVVVYQREKVE